MEVKVVLARSDTALGFLRGPPHRPGSGRKDRRYRHDVLTCAAVRHPGMRGDVPAGPPPDPSQEEQMLLVDASRTSRELVRDLRAIPPGGEALPESVAWQTFLELRKRGEPDATRLFLTAVRNLHSRRCIAGAALPTDDPLPDEHRLTDDAFLAD